MYNRIYIDIIFLANLTVDYFLLRIVGRIFKCKGSKIRYLLAAFIGAVSSCVILYIPLNNYLPFIILLHGIIGLFMIRIGCGLKQRSLLLKAFIALYMTAFLFGGIWEALVTDAKLSLKIFGFTVMGLYCGISGMISLYDSFRIRRRNIYPVTLAYKGKVRSIYGFYDTGNMLTDPVKGSPVSVLSSDVLRLFVSEETIRNLKNLKDNPENYENAEFEGLKPHFVLGRTINEKETLMLAITFDTLDIHTPGEVIYVKNPIMVLDFGSFALGDEYKILLNSRLLQ